METNTLPPLFNKAASNDPIRYSLSLFVNIGTYLTFRAPSRFVLLYFMVFACGSGNSAVCEPQIISSSTGIVDVSVIPFNFIRNYGYEYVHAE